MTECLTPAELDRAAALLRDGGLVAFPTETVYGLGADATNDDAVAAIFDAKQRPTFNPLIIHVIDAVAAARLARFDARADALAARFWPGPLTLVLPRLADGPVSLLASAGLDSLALRVPGHPLPRALIRAVGRPIAAPSANRFTGLSPTTAEHVLKSLGAEVDLILDGGPSSIGIESTVLSLSGAQPRLLRPGMISREEIEEIVGPIEMGPGVVEGGHPSPGLHEKHYSPVTPLFLVDGITLPARGRGAYLWLTCPHPADHSQQMPPA